MFCMISFLRGKQSSSRNVRDPRITVESLCFALLVMRDAEVRVRNPLTAHRLLNISVGAQISADRCLHQSCPFTHHLLIQKSSFLLLTPKRLISVCHASTGSVPWAAGIKQEQHCAVQALPQLPPRQQPRSWRQGTGAHGTTNIRDVCK